MPVYTNNDRQLIHAEAILWACVDLLDSNIDEAGAFTDRIGNVADTARQIARDLRDYNDMFEVDE